MTDTQLKEIVSFIQGEKKSVRLNCENKKEGKVLYSVLAESRTLYHRLHAKKPSLDGILEQIQIKNARAQEYFEVSGKKWLF